MQSLIRILCFLGSLWAVVAQSQPFPSRTITLVTPFPPGASTDAVARLLRDGLSQKLRETVIVENRGGAGGTTGAAFVAKADPDGYTLLVTVSAPVTMNKFMQRNFPFDPATAFTPVSLLAESALFLAVNPSLPVTTVTEFIDYARKNPGKLAYGSAGIGSAHHIAGELLKKKTGIDMVHVPFPGGGPAIQNLIANHISVSFGTAPAVLPHADAGNIRVIATTRATRLPDRPLIPAINETVPGVETITWVGLFAPAGTPQAVIDTLNAATRDVLANSDLIEKFKSQGMTAVASSSAELSQRVTREHKMWAEIIPSIGIAAE